MSANSPSLPNAAPTTDATADATGGALTGRTIGANGAPSGGVRVRTDDFVAGEAFEFAEIIDVLQADRADDVPAVIAAAWAASEVGRWVTGFVAYEAGSVYDRAFPVRTPPPGTPYARFVVWAQRRAIPTLDEEDPSGGREHRLDDLTRVPGDHGYMAGVEEIRRRIALGDAYQVNLTARFHATLDGNPRALYASMARAQRGAYNLFAEFDDLVVISASPELFFAWDGTTVTTKPMKGTIARGARLTEDAAAATTLRASVKDQAENVMIVDLLRNDLSRVAELGSVRVPALFDVERYETVWQLTSTVQASTRPGTTLDDIFAVTFPCGSITGAPKAAAMAIIDGLEPEPRGVYCGAIGVIAPAGHAWRARFSVAIRTGVLDPRTRAVVYGTGGGITWSSDPAAESAEADAKARVLTERRPAFDLLETLRLDHRGPIRVAAHLDRMEASARWFGFPFDRVAAEAALAAVEPVAVPRALRLLLGRLGAWRVESRPLAAGTGAPVRLAIDTERVRSDDTFSRHKTTNRGHYEAARARHPDADDVILVNERAEVVETTIANLLYRLGDDWFTPPLTCGGLNGVGRQLLLDDGAIAERVLLATDLAACDALEVVSSLRGRRTASLLDSA